MTREEFSKQYEEDGYFKIKIVTNDGMHATSEKTWFCEYDDYGDIDASFREVNSAMNDLAEKMNKNKFIVLEEELRIIDTCKIDYIYIVLGGNKMGGNKR